MLHPDLSMSLRGTWRNVSAGAPATLAAPGLPWWHAFNSEQLNSLVNSAMRGNPGVAAARQHLLAARVLQGTASSAFRPGIGFTTGAEPTPAATASYFQAGFDVRWELPLFERGANAARLHESDAMNAEAALQDAQATLIAETVRAYLDASTAGEELAEWRNLQTNAEAALHRVSARIAAGIGEVETQTRLQDQLGVATTSVFMLTQVRSQCLERLAALLGRSNVDEAWLVESAHRSYPLPVPQSLPADLLRARADVRHAEAGVAHAAAELGIARAELYPHVSLVGAVTSAFRLSGGAGLGSNAIVSAGPAISLPLVDWGLRRAQVNAHSALLRAATLEYRQVVLDAVAEGEMAFSHLAIATQSVTALTDMARSADTAAQRASTRRRLGLLDPMAALDMERDALRARVAVRVAAHEQATAFVQLHKALGDTHVSTNEDVAAW